MRSLAILVWGSLCLFSLPGLTEETPTVDLRKALTKAQKGVKVEFKTADGVAANYVLGEGVYIDTKAPTRFLNGPMKSVRDESLEGYVDVEGSVVYEFLRLGAKRESLLPYRLYLFDLSIKRGHHYRLYHEYVGGVQAFTRKENEIFLRTTDGPDTHEYWLTYGRDVANQPWLRVKAHKINGMD